MGKTDKAQAKLHFERRKTFSQTREVTETELEKTSEVPAHEAQDLRHILAAMQQSLTQIDGKIDSLSYRMDRMSERLNKQAERLDQTERRVSTAEDGETALATGQLKVSTELAKLRVDVDRSTIFFTDHKKLEQFVNRKLADKRIAPAADPADD
ncbi:hypothetical protein NDU88_005439 [Pleurodeles waltl]|uniref:Uncharacterized protein n=1 Tax=Pleurodeles waltl TaxID=8319 RepID=A0AAV7TUA4_PLEWA|nr:hypothetical protein NDU88_005439 [Pleurodeles waltl]